MKPSHNLPAERALLGAMLLEPSCVPELCAQLVVEDFFEPKHGLVFQAIQACASKLVGVDYVAVGVELEALHALQRIGGRAFLVELTQDITSAAHSRHHARIVLDAARLRRWAALASEALGAIQETPAGSDASEALQSDLARRAVSIGSGLHAEPVPMGKLSRDAVERLTVERTFENAGMQTGLADLDRQLCGLRGGDMIVVAARPGMGKTALATTVLENVCSRLEPGNGHGLFCSLEMGRHAIVERMLCARAGVSLHAMRKRGPDDEERRSLWNAEREIAALPLTINDAPAQSPMAIRAMAQRVIQKHRKLSLIVVDYLQLVRIKNPESRFQEVSEVSRSLKDIAREYDVPVIALSQLSRQVENRPDKRPQLSDLRESGSIEQDADLVVFVYRESYYNESLADKTATELILAKNRNGPVGKVVVNFDAESMRFTSRVRELVPWSPGQ